MASQWVVFTLDAGRYALPLDSVERIVRAVAVTPLPRAPDVVLGAIDVEGQVLPVFSLRRRFGLEERAILPTDQLLIAGTSDRRVALVMDASVGVIDHSPSDIIDAKQLSGQLEHLKGVIALEDGLVLIQDLEKLLSPEEASALERALKAEAPGEN